MRNEATGTYQTPACRYLAELSVVVAMMMMMMMTLRQLRTFEKKESVNGTSSRVFEESGTDCTVLTWSFEESGTGTSKKVGLSRLGVLLCYRYEESVTVETWSLSRGFPDRSAWIENLRVVICFN